MALKRRNGLLQRLDAHFCGMTRARAVKDESYRSLADICTSPRLLTRRCRRDIVIHNFRPLSCTLRLKSEKLYILSAYSVLAQSRNVTFGGAKKTVTMATTMTTCGRPPRHCSRA